MTAQLWVTVIGQVVILIAAVLGYLSTRRKVGKMDGKVDNVHELVNNQLDRQLDRNAELTATLTAAGVDVPKQQTAEPPAP